MLNFSLIDNTSWISAQCKSSTAPAIIPIRFTHAIISLFCVGVYFFKLRLASGLFGLFFCISNCQVFFNVFKVHTDCASFFCLCSSRLSVWSTTQESGVSMLFASRYGQPLFCFLFVVLWVFTNLVVSHCFLNVTTLMPL